MLNLNHVRSFLEVVDAGGFRPAARRLRLAASTIVEHIDQLERDLASVLLVRLRGRVTLTSQGAVFEPLARALMDTAQRARDILAEAPLRIAASTNVGTYLLPEPVAQFAGRSLTPIETWIGPNLDVANRLTSGRADVAVMEWWNMRPGFDHYVWLSEPLVVIAPAAHRWALRHTISVNELSREPLLGGESGTGTGHLLTAVSDISACETISAP